MEEIGVGSAMNDEFYIIDFQASRTEEIGVEAAKNDTYIYFMNKEIDMICTRLQPGSPFWDSDFQYRRHVLLLKQYYEIEIEKRKMELKIEKIKFEIVKLDKLKVNQVSVEEKRAMQLLGYNHNNDDHQKLLSKSMPLVEEKMKEIGGGQYTSLKSRIQKIKNREIRFNYFHPDLNTALKSMIKKINLLKHDIFKMEGWIFQMKLTKMKIKDITIPDVESARQVHQFNDEESSDNELKTYKYNLEKIESVWRKSCSIAFERFERANDLLGKKQLKASGLDFAIEAGSRTIKQYWQLPLKEPKELLGGVYWKKLELPRKGGFWGWDGVEKRPLALEIYSLKLTPCCSDDDQEEGCSDDDQEDFSVDVSGKISLLIRSGDEPSIININVKRQTLTKKDPYILLDDPTYIPFLSSSCLPHPMIHAKLVLRGSDEPDKLTRSMEVVDEVYMSGKEFSEGTSASSEDVSLGTDKHYTLKLTHGIVVNTVVANISVHLLHPSLADSWDLNCEITASAGPKIRMPVVLANYKKVPVNIDNGRLQLLRTRICVDFFGELVLYMMFFGCRACLRFIPRDCRDNCEHKEALKGITVQVTWSGI